MKAPDIRQASREDLDSLTAMRERFCQEDRHPFDAAVSRAVFAQALDNPHYGEIWLPCSAAGQPLGFGALTFGFSLEYDGRDATIDEIYILSEHRGQGLGTRLMLFLEERARIRGVRYIHLEVMNSNEQARKLYDSLAYKPHDSVFFSKRLA